MGLHFSEDWMAPRERFETLSSRLGEAFKAIHLGSAPGNGDGFGRQAHAVLTLEVRETPEDHPALRARAEVTAFLHERRGG
ncbi:hypothetical protein ACIPJK_38485 [Streptomyces roseus]|uniref:hypothetical protein n=1 Tax=Streptomyces roseus TaxID=66430 RepID=UPI003802ED20